MINEPKQVVESRVRNIGFLFAILAHKQAIVDLFAKFDRLFPNPGPIKNQGNPIMSLPGLSQLREMC